MYFIKAFVFLAFFYWSSGTAQSKPASSLQDNGKGLSIYLKKCAVCHGKDGNGKGKRNPPLNKSDYLTQNIDQSISGILYGITGAITVNDIVYDRKMKAVKLTDQEVADVMNYILNAWDNENSVLITATKVAKIRKNEP